MSEAKHTPGPWFIGPMHAERGVPVQRGKEGGFLVYGLSLDREKADARLIAAAPDLLDALEGMINGSEWNEERGRFSERVLPTQEAFIAARAAIAKARGEA